MGKVIQMAGLSLIWLKMLRDRSVNCDLRLVATDGDFNAAYTRPTKHKQTQEVIKNNLQHKIQYFQWKKLYSSYATLDVVFYIQICIKILHKVWYFANIISL